MDDLAMVAEAGDLRPLHFSEEALGAGGDLGENGLVGVPTGLRDLRAGVGGRTGRTMDFHEAGELEANEDRQQSGTFDPHFLAQLGKKNAV